MVRPVVLIFAAALAVSSAIHALEQAEPRTVDFREAVELEEAIYQLMPKGTWGIESMREMTRNIASLSDMAAAEIIWIAASAPPQVDTTNFFANALGSSSATVRIIAASAMAGSQIPDVRRLLLNALSTEQDPDVAYTIVQGVSRLPRNQAVRFLIDIVALTILPEDTMRTASQELRRLTRADVPDDAGAWHSWWLDNEDRYE